MNRRSFIKNTALAATMVGITPSVMASDLKGGKKKKIIFVFRGVSYQDAEQAFKKASFDESNMHFQKVICEKADYSHDNGMMFLRESSVSLKQFNLIRTEKLDRYKISEVISDSINSTEKTIPIVHLHHTEIGHSSNKLYIERLDDFFAELKKAYNPLSHKIVVTADIGRNSQFNSCGGKDHSNETSLETFVLYMGGKASQLKSNLHSTKQNQILAQKF